MSNDPEQEYFSDGLTDTLITDLSRLPSLFVIARNSTFTYKGKAVDVREVSDKDSPVEVSFTVTNESSHQSADHPEILFENLVLTIDTPHGSHNTELGSLSPQDSVTHTEVTIKRLVVS